MPYYKIIIELAGKARTGIREHAGETDTAFLAFQSLAKKSYGDKLLYFNCMQLSRYSEDVKLFIKQKGKTGRTTLDPLPEHDFELPVDGNNYETSAFQEEGPGQ